MESGKPFAISGRFKTEGVQMIKAAAISLAIQSLFLRFRLPSEDTDNRPRIPASGDIDM
jgi:hypothetical protein